MKKIIITSLFAFSVLAFGLQTSAFTYPGGAPTGGGANIAPLNVGPFAQIKQGILSAPFFGSHKVDIQPCQSGSVLVGGGTSCGDIGATGSHNLFKAGGIGVNPIALFVKNNGSTFAGWKTSTNFFQSTSNPIDVFRAGQVNDADALSGISVNQNGQFSVRGMTPNNPGDVLTAVDSTGLVTWAPASGGTNLPAGTFNQTLRYGVISPGVFGWTAESGLSSSGNSVKIFDAYNPANASVAAEGMGGQSPTLNLAGTFRYRGIGGVTPAAGSVLTSDAQGYATWQPAPNGLPNGSTNGDILVWNGTTWIVQQPVGVTGITGSGTLNYLSKWTPDGTTLGNSQLFDNGTSVGVGATNPGYKLDVSGDIRARGTWAGSGTNASLYLGDQHQFIRATNGSGLSLNTFQAQNALVIKENTGNVGIGIANPLRKLDVEGAIHARNTSVFPEGLGVGLNTTQVGAGSNAGVSFGGINAMLDVAGEVRFRSTNASPAIVAGDVLTAIDSSGNARWRPAPSTLPAGTNDATLRWNGTAWVLNNTLLANGSGKVRIGANLGSTMSGTSDLIVAGSSILGLSNGSITYVGLPVTNQNLGLDVSGLVKIRGGNPGQGKVLTSDSNGLATWESDALPDGDVVLGLGSTLVWVSTAPGEGEWVSNSGVRSSTNATQINTPFTSMPNYVSMSTNQNSKTVIGHSSQLTETKLDILGKVKITGGDPGDGKVLTSDATGSAAWKTINSSLIQGDSIVRVRRDNPVHVAYAWCPVGYIVIGGGGDCESEIKISQPVPVMNGNCPSTSGTGASAGGSCTPTNILDTPRFNNVQGWRVQCSGAESNDAHAEAICLKVN
ncbi:MAG: hypothetical protein K9M36_01075 [Candidatus Pacebacteria bacterium]|nr:hypothetical protein [Candidatus Paceibacterota bacterium]